MRERRSTLAPRVFLLSPASAAGERAKLLFDPRARFELAARVQGSGATLGEVYAFISGLYFRGKLAYTAAFARPPQALPAGLVIAPGRGLVPLAMIVTLAELREIAAVPIDLRERRYTEPLERDARHLATAAGGDCRLILLGSVATDKYFQPLLAVFGERLLFPAEFVGRGDMSRGGLMLRCARTATELTYISASSAVRHGERPPKLARLPRVTS